MKTKDKNKWWFGTNKKTILDTFIATSVGGILYGLSIYYSDILAKIYGVVENIAKNILFLIVYSIDLSYNIFIAYTIGKFILSIIDSIIDTYLSFFGNKEQIEKRLKKLRNNLTRFFTFGDVKKDGLFFHITYMLIILGLILYPIVPICIKLTLIYFWFVIKDDFFKELLYKAKKRGGKK